MANGSQIFCRMAKNKMLRVPFARRLNCLRLWGDMGSNPNFSGLFPCQQEFIAYEIPINFNTSFWHKIMQLRVTFSYMSCSKFFVLICYQASGRAPKQNYSQSKVQNSKLGIFFNQKIDRFLSSAEQSNCCLHIKARILNLITELFIQSLFVFAAKIWCLSGKICGLARHQFNGLLNFLETVLNSKVVSKKVSSYLFQISRTPFYVWNITNWKNVLSVTHVKKLFSPYQKSVW